MQQPVRDTPEQQAGDRAMTARTDDDEIGSEFAGDVGNHVGCVRGSAAHELEARIDPFLAQLLDLPLDLRLDLAFISENGMTSRSAAEQLLAVDGHQAAAGACQLLRIR